MRRIKLKGLPHLLPDGRIDGEFTAELAQV